MNGGVLIAYYRCWEICTWSSTFVGDSRRKFEEILVGFCTLCTPEFVCKLL